MICIFLAGVLSVFVAWTQYYRKHWGYGLEARLTFGADYLYAGQQTFITEKIENAKRMPLPVLEIAFKVRKELQFPDMENTSVSDFTYKRDVFSVLGWQRIIRSLPLECKKRGYYRIEQVEFVTYSLLHDSFYKRVQPESCALYVYAKRVDVSELTVCCERLLGANICSRKLYEDPFAFRGIREYCITDPMKTINWKASAKAGGLMVNTFDSTLTQRVMIYLNVEDEGIIRHENLIEEGISVAASAAQRLLAKGMEVGISVNAQENGFLSPGGGGRQLASIEQLLAKLDIRQRAVPFAHILAELPEDVMPVFISANENGAGSAIAAFLGGGREGVWVALIPAASSGAKSAADIAPAQPGSRLRVLVRKVAGA